METQGGGLQPGAVGFVYAYDATGAAVPGWPVKMPGTVEYYGSAQEFITEGDSSAAPADLSGTGAGPDSVALGPVLSPPYLIDGTGQIVSKYGAAASWPPMSAQDVPVAFTTSGAFGKVGGVLSFAQAETGSTSLAEALLQPESGKAINEYEAVYPATGDDARPGCPAVSPGHRFPGRTRDRRRHRGRPGGRGGRGRLQRHARLRLPRLGTPGLPEVDSWMDAVLTRYRRSVELGKDGPGHGDPGGIPVRMAHPRRSVGQCGVVAGSARRMEQRELRDRDEAARRGSRRILGPRR